MDLAMLPCPRCHAETFFRKGYSHMGSAVESYCPCCGWTKTRAIEENGQIYEPTGEPLIVPQDIRERNSAAGRKGGKATAKKYGAVGVALRGKKIGSRVGPYKPRKPRTKPGWWSQEPKKGGYASPGSARHELSNNNKPLEGCDELHG